MKKITIFNVLLILLSIIITKESDAATLLVTNTNDNGSGSIRQAILDANANIGADIIAFSIGSGGAHIITPLTELPSVTDSITIDGSTQPGFVNTPLISIAFSGTSLTLNGVEGAVIQDIDLSLTAPNSGGTGLFIFNSSNVTVQRVSANNRNTAINVIGGSDIQILNNDLSNSGIGTTYALKINNVTSGLIPGGVIISGNSYGYSEFGVKLQNMSDLSISDGSVPSSNIILENLNGLETMTAIALNLANVSNVFIDNLNLSFAGVSKTGTGLYLDGCSSLSVQNVVATNRSTAFEVNEGTDIRIIDNDLSSSSISLRIFNLIAGTIPGGVEISGNTFTNSDFGVRFIGLDGLVISNGTVSSSNVILEDFSGINTITGTALFLDDVTNFIVDNVDLSYTGVSRSGAGLIIENSDVVTAQNIYVNNRTEGIRIVDGSDIAVLNNDLPACATALSINNVSAGSLAGGVMISENTFTTSTDAIKIESMDGLVISDGTNPLTNVELNSASDLGTTTGIALWLRNVTNSTVEFLDLSYSGSAPIGTAFLIQNSAVLTVQNITASNRNTAVSISGASGANLSCGSILNNDTGFSFSNATGINLFDNHIEGNNTGVRNGPTDPLIMAENNYWGAMDGPGNLGGSGDSYIGNVDADPFLNSLPSCILLAAADIDVLPTVIDFGHIQVSTPAGPVTITISNFGMNDLNVSDIILNNNTDNEFSLLNLPAFPVIVPANGGSVTFEVTYYPIDASTDHAGIEIFSNDPDEGLITITLQGSGVMGNTPGTISGTVLVGGNGLPGVVVSLLDIHGIAVSGVDSVFTDSQGSYSITGIDPDIYLVNIFEPLGFSALENPIADTLLPGVTDIIDFHLYPVVSQNQARGTFYWTRQFRQNYYNIGTPTESKQDLLNYISQTHSHYTPHFDIFKDDTTMYDWLRTLRFWGNFSRYKRARRELAALVMNMVSGKVGQYSVVTADCRTAGDVLTYVSILVSDGDQSNDHLARKLARKVNKRNMIAAGIVPASNILYKGGEGLPDITWSFGVPQKFALHQNYPNPFNPTTTIEFDLPTANHVSMEIYNIMGQRVRTLISDNMEAGRHSIAWNATNDFGIKVSSGMYFYRIITKDFHQIKRMILLK